MYLVRQVAERKHASLSFPDLLHLLKYVQVVIEVKLID